MNAMNEINHLTPEQIAAQAGVDLAFEANKAYDAHDPKFSKIAETAGSLMGRGSLGEGAVDEAFNTTIPSETVEASDVIESSKRLTPEQQKKADGAVAAMAEKFGVAPEGFSILRTKADDGREGIVVALTSPNGLYKGSWNQIMDKKSDKDFVIEVDGQKVDTRKGMTRATYRAFITEAQAQSPNNPLPDSNPLSKENGEPWTATWLTGEQAGVRNAPCAGVNAGQGYEYWYYRGNDRRGLRVRPAVVIE